MRTPVLVLCFVFCTVLWAVAEIVSYRGDILLLPDTGEIKEALSLRFVAPTQGSSRLELYLNRDLTIQSLSCDQCAVYKEGEVDTRNNARLIVISFRRSLKPRERSDIAFTCGGKLVHVSSDTNSFSPHWIELSIDSAWYPYEPENRNFRYDLRVKIDPAYKLSGNAQVSSGNGIWHLKQKRPTLDIDLVAGRSWTTSIVDTGRLRVRINAVDVPAVVVRNFAQLTGETARTFSEWFGNAPARDLTVILNPRGDSSSYSRPGYVSLACSKDPAQLNRLMFTLTHEIAHFWWLRAPGETWENWLNESMAEYSALMYVRNAEGETAFNELMSQRVERSKDKPAIWGVDRKSQMYATVIYAKGAVRLQQLEQMVGRDKFRRFLATLVRKQIKTTQAFLDELQAESSVEVRQQFERLLKS
jgi:hypothetical protein